MIVLNPHKASNKGGGNAKAAPPGGGILNPQQTVKIHHTGPSNFSGQGDRPAKTKMDLSGVVSYAKRHISQTNGGVAGGEQTTGGSTGVGGHNTSFSRSGTGGEGAVPELEYLTDGKTRGWKDGKEPKEAR